MAAIGNSSAINLSTVKLDKPKLEKDGAQSVRNNMLNRIKNDPRLSRDVITVLSEFSKKDVSPTKFYSIASRIAQSTITFSSGKVDTSPEDFSSFLDSQNSVLESYGVNLKLDISSISKKTNDMNSGNAVVSHDKTLIEGLNINYKQVIG